jgi:Tol biopolymer transport system component
MDAQRVRAQLDRILASATFTDAERASSFLRFVVDRALDGRAGEIKESVIAVEVLGRSPSFDSKSDPIVRVEAGRLRARLSSYYQGEGETDSVLIALPKGSYVPEFTQRQLLAQPLAKTRHPVWLLAGGTLFGLVAALVVALSYFHRAPGPADVLRLSILPPENAAFESFAVSPDGRKLAFTAALNGKLMLWVRALDSLEPRPLAGTEDAYYPFWSPDSRSVGFFATPYKLKTIEIAGGPARDIADVVMGWGGAWSPEGVIVFCPRPLGILYQVAATGGTPKPVTSLDAARAEVAHGFPQFLPDGRHFLYFAASSRPGESSIRAGSLDSTISKVLVNAETNASYAPVLHGHSASLLFVHDNALMAQPFNPRRLELSGERTVVLSEVRYRRWSLARFSVSSNGVLVYEGGSAENRQFAWFDRQGKRLASAGPRNDYAAFSLSPDERHVAVQRYDDPDAVFPTIWVMDLLREGAVSRFTDTGVAEAYFGPVWSPNGDEILFSQGDDRKMRLLRQALNGGSANCVLDTEGPKFPTDWSSDGHYVTYYSQWPDYRYGHTYTVSLSATNQREKTRAFLQHSYTETDAYFSPSRRGEAPRWIAYASNETGREEVYVRDFPAGSHKWQVSNQGGLLPHWRRDGRELFFLTPDGTLMAVTVKPGATFEVGTPQALFGTGLQRMAHIGNQYAVTHDGQRFLLNRHVTEIASSAITAVISR